VKIIEASCFANCVFLESVTIPDSVESINSKAFSNCKTLHSVSIGKGIKHIVGDVFSKHENILKITITAENPPFISIEYDWIVNTIFYVPLKNLSKYELREGYRNRIFPI